MQLADCRTIDRLHITSWDEDHCQFEELKLILNRLQPKRVDYPGYPPHTDNGKNSLDFIRQYGGQKVEISPAYRENLSTAERWECRDVLYNPSEISDNSNDNSVVTLFRCGRFTVLSLGDCESNEIAVRIGRDSIASNETDVLILAHHGADNGFTTPEFIHAIKPKIAVCSSNYDNEFDHPKPAIRNMLSQADVTLYTTKLGDVVIICGDDDVVRAYNLGANDQKTAERKFEPKSPVASRI
jgi:competence protein ComEC